MPASNEAIGPRYCVDHGDLVMPSATGIGTLPHNHLGGGCVRDYWVGQRVRLPVSVTFCRAAAEAASQDSALCRSAVALAFASSSRRRATCSGYNLSTADCKVRLTCLVSHGIVMLYVVCTRDVQVICSLDDCM